jgi:hypothetical protein
MTILLRDSNRSGSLFSLYPRAMVTVAAAGRISRRAIIPNARDRRTRRRDSGARIGVRTRRACRGVTLRVSVRRSIARRALEGSVVADIGARGGDA